MKNFAISVFIIFLNTIIFNCGVNTEEVDYYEELINEGIQNSSSYQPPHDASEYKHTNSVPIAFGGVCPFPRGKGLGGTSILNALIYVRGNRLDYDKWEDLGNPGWAYKDVLPYFIKSENSNINGDPGYHGFGGYLNVEYHTPLSERVKVFLEANKQQGRCVLDYNGEEQIGASRNQFTAVQGRRLSSSNAFIDPVRNRTNLHILTESYVTRILISNTTMKAYAILFSRKNVEYSVKVNKEVILSAGIVGSAQILLQSGVGPENELQQLGIPVIKNLTVGENLHDHLTFYSNYFLTYQQEPSFDLRDAIKQFLNGTGPLTVSTNTQGLSFYRLGLTDYGVPDIEIIIVPSVKSGGFDTMKKGVIHGHADEDRWGKSIAANHVFQIIVVLLHPKTRGKIYLKSNNPYDYPIIDSRCLADPHDEDIEGIYQGIQIVLKLVKTNAFKELKPVLLPYPDCLHEVFLTKEYWKCLIRQTALNAYHGGGTCQMGPDPMKGAVVNNRLQVHGISNVRVADTSIVPITISGHMQAPAMMIGERAADFVKEDHDALNN
ncbi:hypothetical protein ILUMI_05411 [Ignelater luminosus]|uniref:Glucose-methanol-choline oxidoreductase N-terminal domain-containing protein n=1 Tax=Ignelater luminosus TaxID=2038154 RepID=A0A8K0GIP6_IGNLU|nr:hypothetical protein ILUMI_05411 [Ignelater luminosus]